MMQKHLNKSRVWVTVQHRFIVFAFVMIMVTTTLDSAPAFCQAELFWQGHIKKQISGTEHKMRFALCVDSNAAGNNVGKPL